jgi:hypothetical protein
MTEPEVETQDQAPEQPVQDASNEVAPPVEPPIETPDTVVTDPQESEVVTEPEVETVETEMAFPPIPETLPRHKNFFAPPQYLGSESVSEDNPLITHMDSSDYDTNKNKENK